MRYNPTPNDGRGLYLPDEPADAVRNYYLTDVAKAHVRAVDGSWIPRADMRDASDVHYLTREEALVLKAELRRQDIHVRLGH